MTQEALTHAQNTARALQNVALGLESDAAREVMEGAELIERQAAQLRLLQGDTQNTDHTHPDYLEGLNAKDRDLASDMLGISAFGLLSPFARGRARAAGLALRAQAEEMVRVCGVWVVEEWKVEPNTHLTLSIWPTKEIAALERERLTKLVRESGLQGTLFSLRFWAVPGLHSAFTRAPARADHETLAAALYGVELDG